MLSVVAGIKNVAEIDPFFPALVAGPRVISYGDLLAAIARVSNHLADRGLRPGTKVFLTAGDPDVRLIVSIACLHCRLIPFILKEIGDLNDECDIDLVIGTGGAHEAAPRADILLDNALIVGTAAADLRDFGGGADGDVVFVASTTGTT